MDIENLPQQMEVQGAELSLHDPSRHVAVLDSGEISDSIRPVSSPQMLSSPRLNRFDSPPHSRKSVSRRAVISELDYRLLAPQPVDLLAPRQIQTRLLPCVQRLLLPGFHQDGHPNMMLNIATVPTGQLTRTGLPPVGPAASSAALKLLLPPRWSGDLPAH
jgi:hypothetical protein